MIPIFKKKHKKPSDFNYSATSNVECNISIVYLDNFREIEQLAKFGDCKGKGLSHMIIKMDIDTSTVTNLKEYKCLFTALKSHNHYIDENGSLIIMDNINKMEVLEKIELPRIIKDESYDTSLTLCYQLKEFLSKVLDEEGEYDEVYRATNHISLSSLSDSTERTCEIINEFTYDYPHKKTCMVLRIDSKVIDWIKNIIYYVYDHDFYWIKEVQIDDYRTFIVIEDIEFVANQLEPHYLSQIDNDEFETRFKKLSQTEQKVYQYFMDFLRRYRTTTDFVTEDDVDDSEDEYPNVDFSDIDEVIE